ncbi:MAG: hypothetical protein ACHREM_09785 [Polyangiales bacterium]
MNQHTPSRSLTRSCGRLGFGVLLALMMTATAVPAFAQEHAQPVTMVVRLRNGASVQGELVENYPGDHVTLRLATGEIRTIVAADIDTTSGSASPAVTITTVTVGDATTHAHADADGATVHVDAHRTEPSLRPAPVISPSDDVEVGRTFYVEPSPLLSPPIPTWTPPLIPSPIDDANSGIRTAGWVLLLSGAAVAIPSLYLLTQSDSGPDEPGPSTKQIIGIDLLGLALPAVIMGVVFVSSSSPSSFSHVGGPLPPPPCVGLGDGLFLGPKGVMF